MRDMIALFGGLRFHYMDVFRVKCVQLLLDGTLEILRLYSAGPSGVNLPKCPRRIRNRLTNGSRPSSYDPCSGFGHEYFLSLGRELSFSVVRV